MCEYIWYNNHYYIKDECMITLIRNIFIMHDMLRGNKFLTDVFLVIWIQLFKSLEEKQKMWNLSYVYNFYLLLENTHWEMKSQAYDYHDI